jgi:hypothetical protein
MVQQIYQNVRGNPSEKSNANISTRLDSVKPYQFEVHLTMPGQFPASKEIVMIGATKVTGLGMEVENIEVHRVNDKVFYPSKAKMEPVVITFDDQIESKLGPRLWSFLTRTMDNKAGTIAPSLGNLATPNPLKIPSMKIVQLKNDLLPFSETTLYGVYCMAWKSSEFNYATTNAFHTIDMTFRYDFMEHTSTKDITP